MLGWGKFYDFSSPRTFGWIRRRLMSQCNPFDEHEDYVGQLVAATATCGTRYQRPGCTAGFKPQSIINSRSLVTVRHVLTVPIVPSLESKYELVSLFRAKPLGNIR
jgi:hypothetical protein